MDKQLHPAGWLVFSAEDVRKGIPAARIKVFETLGIERRLILRAIGAPSPLRRRKLTRDESDRLARLARVVDRTLALFGSTENAVRWLLQPISLRPDDRTPLDMVETDPGAEWVIERLARTGFGMVA